MIPARILRTVYAAHGRMIPVEWNNPACSNMIYVSGRYKSGGYLRFFSARPRTESKSRIQTSPLILKYNDLISEKALKVDQRQHRLISELSILLEKLKLKAVPKGIYIHGSVGTGKSMLFDLFFEAARQILPDKAASRFHFHEFMISIHKHIHEYKQQAANSQGAIATIGKQLVENGGLRLLCLDEFQV